MANVFLKPGELTAVLGLLASAGRAIGRLFL
jgi:hypothetical protein